MKHFVKKILSIFFPPIYKSGILILNYHSVGSISKFSLNIDEFEKQIIFLKNNYEIISFPNFAYIENRLEMLLKGVMPKKMLYGYTWYSIGHIHQLSVKDFKELCDKNNLIINKEEYLGFFSFIARFCFKNLLSRVGIYLCQKK